MAPKAQLVFITLLRALVVNSASFGANAMRKFGLCVCFACAGALAGCPVDDRTLEPIDVTVGVAGRHGMAGSGGDFSSGAGGDAGSAGETGGTLTGGIGAGSGGAAPAGSGGSSGMPALGGAGAGASGCGCAVGGAAKRCPDIDGNKVLDCDETLAQNAGFDADVSTWANDTGASTKWDERDAHSRTDSGALSLELETVVDKEGTVLLGTRQCFSASGGAVYRFATEVSVPVETASARAGIQLIPYASPACNGTLLDNVTSNLIQGTTWSVAEITYLMPVAAKSVALRLIAIKPFKDEPTPILFDNVLVRTD